MADAHEIKLPCGRVALIDAADLHLTEGFKLYSEVRKYTVYVQCHKKGLPHGRYIYLHKLITGWERTDHRDRDALNNRRSNLRECTNAQNCRNSGKRPGRNPYKGVTIQKSTGKWTARVCVDYKNLYVGLFDTPEEAAKAYDAAARIHHGEFAWLNFPDAR